MKSGKAEKHDKIGQRITDQQVIDQQIEETILRLLEERRAGTTICPSEAARAVDPDAWRELMERTRAVAERLAASGKIVVTQRGRVVDPATAKGAIRLRRAQD
jgi:hypothetical protein